MNPYETGRFAAVEDAQVQAVSGPQDLALLVAQMHLDLLESGRDAWENATLERFLEALASLLANCDPELSPRWPEFARLLVVATGYE